MLPWSTSSWGHWGWRTSRPFHRTWGSSQGNGLQFELTILYVIQISDTDFVHTIYLRQRPLRWFPMVMMLENMDAGQTLKNGWNSIFHCPLNIYVEYIYAIYATILRLIQTEITWVLNQLLWHTCISDRGDTAQFDGSCLVASQHWCPEMCAKILACPLTLLYHSIVKGGANKQRTRIADTKNNKATLLAINCPRSIRQSVCQPHQREPLANGVRCFWMLPWINSFSFFEKTATVPVPDGQIHVTCT